MWREFIWIEDRRRRCISTGRSYKSNISADYEHLVLRIDARALTEKLAAMTGATISQPLLMEAQQSVKHPAAQMLQQYIPLLVESLSRATPPPDWWIAQTEQLVMTLFLCGHRHNYSHLLEQQPRDAAPLQIRRAEEYIETHAQRTVTLEELAEITGVSAFSLFSTFKKYRGYSLSDFCRKCDRGAEEDCNESMRRIEMPHGVVNHRSIAAPGLTVPLPLDQSAV